MHLNHRDYKIFLVDSFFKDNPSMSMINDSDEEIYKYVITFAGYIQSNINYSENKSVQQASISSFLVKSISNLFSCFL